MLVAALGMFAVGAIGAAATSSPSPFPVWALGFVYAPMAALYIYPGVKLWQYGSAISRVEASRAPADLESALEQQKSFWKYSGVTLIVMVALYALFIVGAVGVGVMGALNKH
jgi:hypothetical protein